MNQNKYKIKRGQLILFCGLPGTLKTYIASRLSSKIGFGYLPTNIVGKVESTLPIALLNKERKQRYKNLGKLSEQMLSIGANIVVDGGFSTKESRSFIINKNANNCIIVHCYCPNDQLRMDRLRSRSLDRVDYENKSAKDIIYNNFKDGSIQFEDINKAIQSGLATCLFNVDTEHFTIDQIGNTSSDTCNSILEIIQAVLNEYQLLPISGGYNINVEEHFNELAPKYNITTNWRADETLLKTLQKTLPLRPSKILDIGVGTGLASQWYSEQGHNVVGLDVSPSMLREASKYITISVLANAAKLPFIDNYFDLIIARQCLHYLDLTRTLSEVYRTLKKERCFVVSAIICPDEESAILWQEYKNITQPLRLRIFTEKNLKDLLLNQGFKIDDTYLTFTKRTEMFIELEERSIPVAGGLNNFLINFSELAKYKAPQMEFTFENNVISYTQSWVTLWARKT